MTVGFYLNETEYRGVNQDKHKNKFFISKHIKYQRWIWITILSFSEDFWVLH
jgi:hypothetical protein